MFFKSELIKKEILSETFCILKVKIMTLSTWLTCSPAHLVHLRLCGSAGWLWFNRSFIEISVRTVKLLRQEVQTQLKKTTTKKVL